MFKKFMERTLIEARIRKIIDYMKNQNLAQHLEIKTVKNKNLEKKEKEQEEKELENLFNF